MTVLTREEMDVLLDQFLEGGDDVANQEGRITLKYGTDTFSLVKEGGIILISKECNGKEEIRKVLEDAEPSIWKDACAYIIQQKFESLTVGGTKVTPHQLFSRLLCRITQ